MSKAGLVARTVGRGVAIMVLTALFLSPELTWSAGPTDLTDEDLVLFPIPPNPIPAGESVAELNLSVLLQLSLGDHYQITTQINSVVGTFGNMGDPANPETWDVFNMEGQFRFLGAPEGVPDAMVTLVLLGFRKGPTTADPPADIGYVFNSFEGAPDAFFVEDESGDGQGQIQDLFGDVFLAFQFATTCDPCSFGYQIAAREPLSTIQSFNTAFVETATCGDGTVDVGEACDDGNTVTEVCDYGLASCTVCAADCTEQAGATSYCGDLAVDAGNGEECDDGNNDDADGCEADCTLPFCRNDIVDPPEECDDGNNTPGDGCENDCTLTPPPACGDNNLDPNETCDPPGTPAGGNGNQCRGDCTVCGDAIINGAEACDDGNGINGDACENDCTLPICGNGILDVGEECDDGNNIDADGCEADCTNPFCGNGIVDPPEECDPPLLDSNELCDDNIDNDADGLVDCDDPDCPAFCSYVGMPDPNGLVDPNAPCTSHKDCRVQFGASASCVSEGICGADCHFANMCNRPTRDPAQIRFAKKPEQLDYLTLHGRFAVPREPDPIAEGFEVILLNEHGTIYSGMLLPGEISPKGKNYGYKDKSAKRTGGIFLVRVKYQVIKGQLNMNFRVKAYGDFSSATEPDMTFRVSVGNVGGFERSDWTQTSNGWRLFFK